MMMRLMDALQSGQDVGHYGRLVFAMVGRHFLDEEELVNLLANSRGFDEHQARGLLEQCRQRDYNPPRPDKIRQWQAQQDFQICPSDDPDACNVYQNLTFPQGTYESINDYYEQKAEAHEMREQQDGQTMMADR
jgi:DNA primase large subunit